MGSNYHRSTTITKVNKMKLSHKINKQTGECMEFVLSKKKAEKLEKKGRLFVSDLTEQEAVTVNYLAGDMVLAGSYMDDAIREELHSWLACEGAEPTHQDNREWLGAYAVAHAIVHKQDWLKFIN